MRTGMGIGPDQGHAGQAPVMDRAFEQQLVIAQKITVVSGENNHGVVSQSQVFELGQNAANGVVNHADGAVVQCDGLAGFALGASKQGLCIFDGRLFIALLVQGFDMGCQSCMRRMKRGRQYNFFRLIHVPVFARGCERVVWVWERAMQKKWSICSLCLLQPGHGPFCDPMGRVQVLGQSGAPGLLAAAELKRWCGQGIVVANEFIHMGVLLASPTPPMAEFIIGMVTAQVHMVKAVKRGFDVAGWVVFPSFPNFLPMATRRLAARLVAKRGVPGLGYCAGLISMFCRWDLPT